MKRVPLIALILLAACAVVAFGQTFDRESDLYPKTVTISRIYNHSRGFRIDYIRQDYSVGTFWAPIAWFRGNAGIGEIAYGEGDQYPYITFFYKDGSVDHFRLYIVENYNHPSWGSLEAGVDYSGEFPADDARPDISF